MTDTDAPWASRIVDFQTEVDPAVLSAHPLNARTHPEHQRAAIRGSLDRIGWVDVVKVNARTGRIVDGHARVEEATRAGQTVPVLYVDLDDDEEAVVLASIDPIGALAEYDNQLLLDLLNEVGDLEGTGFGEDSIADLEALLDELDAGAAAIVANVPGAVPEGLAYSNVQNEQGVSTRQLSYGERAPGYSETGVRSVILDLSLPHFQWWADHAAEARSKFGVETNSMLALHLLAAALEIDPPE
jgi:hypothetical protein